MFGPSAYFSPFKGKINSYGLEITELSTHIQGQLVAVHSAHDVMFDVFDVLFGVIFLSPRDFLCI